MFSTWRWYIERQFGYYSAGPSYVERLAIDLGLQLNRTKSEIICKDPIIVEAMIQAAPGLKVVNSDDVFLLGSPIGSLKSIEDAIGE